MILTGKALSSFNEWNYNDDYGYIDIEPTSLTVGFKDIDDYIQNYIIIDWLDSVGIILEIGVYPQDDNSIVFSYTIYGNNPYETNEHYTTRQQATEEAIKQANLIYNESKD